MFCLILKDLLGSGASSLCDIQRAFEPANNQHKLLNGQVWALIVFLSLHYSKHFLLHVSVLLPS